MPQAGAGCRTHLAPPTDTNRERLFHLDGGTLAPTLLQAAAGLFLLYVGGESLVRGSAALALRLGVSSLAVGLTVVAFGTSAPELVVSMEAALEGANEIAVGNVVGSNICNIALILGIASLLRPPKVEAKVVRLDVPLMIASSLVLLVMLGDGEVSRLEGVLLLVGLFVYVCCTVWQARRENEAGRQALQAATPMAQFKLAAEIVMVLVGLGLLIGGGRLLVYASIELAAGFGVSQAVIGLTIVAVGTSLPEMATSIVASVEGQGDIAVGNVVGSNIFNVLGILGLTATTSPLNRGAIGWTSLLFMVLVSAALIPLFRRSLRLSRWEGGLLLAAYGGYVAWLLAA